MKQKFLVVFSMIFALIVSYSSSQFLFVSGKPKFNSELVVAIFQKSTKFTNLALLFNQKSQMNKNVAIVQNSVYKGVIASMNFVQVQKGVYAGEHNNNTVTRFKENEIIWKNYTFNLKQGGTINIKVPDGTGGLTQNEVDALYGK